MAHDEVRVDLDGVGGFGFERAFALDEGGEGEWARGGDGADGLGGLKDDLWEVKLAVVV